MWTGPTPDASVDKAFLMPCTRNNACIGVPTPEASPAMLPNYVDFFYDTREDRCWSDESILQCGSTDGSQCPFNAHQAEMTGQVSNPLSSSSCTMRPLGAFDYWRIAPPFGNWGRALPRTGHVIHSNKIAASGLAALRAFNIARYPVEVWPQEGFLRLPLSNPAVDGPAPIGQPAIFPWVGPFPCTHLMDNDKTGLRGTTAFPAGVDLASVFGGNYCGNRDASTSGLNADGTERSGCNRDKWKDFETHNSNQAHLRRQWMAANDTRTPAQAYSQYPPDLEIFRWVYWRHRKCTCPWPSPSWAYAEYFKSTFGTGWGGNSCIKPGNWSQVPKQVAELGAKTLKEAGKAALDKVRAEGQAVANSVTTGLEDMVGGLSNMASVGGLAGAENTALEGGVAETSSTLDSFSSLSGGHSDTASATGPTHTAGGLQSQHVASLQGPQTGATEIDGVSSDATRPAMQITVTDSWDNVESVVYSNEDVMSVESNYVDQLNPPGNRFGDPSASYGGVVPGAVVAVPLIGECTLGLGSDCNDGSSSDWSSIVPDLNADYSDVANLDPDTVLTGTVTDNAGTGVCDQAETVACAGRHCTWRQCASNCTFSHCGAPYCNPPTRQVQVCGNVGNPPVHQCWMETRCNPCTPCCHVKAGEVESQCGSRPNCAAFHAGCCKQDTPGNLVQVELGAIGIDIPGGECEQQTMACQPSLCPGIGSCGPGAAC